MLSCTILNAQVIKIEEGVSMIGKSDVSFIAWIKKKGYSAQRQEVSDMLKFTFQTSLGDQNLLAAIKDHKVSAISWEEHIVYASTLVGDVQMAGFKMKDAVDSRVLPFENTDKALRLTLIAKEDVNQIQITIGRSKSK